MSNALRFDVGMRVECNCGTWEAGTVTKQHYAEADGSSSSARPYQVKLDSGNLVFAPRDDDRCIRAEIPIDTRERAVARVASALPTWHAQPLFAADFTSSSHGTMARVFNEYVTLVRAFVSGLDAHEARAYPWEAFHLEVALLLLGLKPSVLIAHGRSPTFSERLATHVFQPWISAMDPPPSPGATGASRRAPSGPATAGATSTVA